MAELSNQSGESNLWVGLDRGSSQLSIAVVAEDGTLLGEAQNLVLPAVQGRAARDVERLRSLLPTLDQFRGRNLVLVGEAGDDFVQLLRAEGWVVARTVAFNDVVNHFGLGEMPGNCIVAACGSWHQVVWIDHERNVRWPGEDVTSLCPEWRLRGYSYVEFLLKRHRDVLPPGSRTNDLLGQEHAPMWRQIGGIFASLAEERDVLQFLEDGAARLVETYRVFCHAANPPGLPSMAMGGGALADDRVWSVVASAVERAGIPLTRLMGSPAVGAVRFAQRYGDRQVWGWFGECRPGWLDWSKEDWERYYAEEK